MCFANEVNPNYPPEQLVVGWKIFKLEYDRILGPYYCRPDWSSALTDFLEYKKDVPYRATKYFNGDEYIPGFHFYTSLKDAKIALRRERKDKRLNKFFIARCTFAGVIAFGDDDTHGKGSRERKGGRALTMVINEFLTKKVKR